MDETFITRKKKIIIVVLTLSPAVATYCEQIQIASKWKLIKHIPRTYSVSVLLIF